MNLYTYVIGTDSGPAPNFEPPFATLAICKPDIRRCASVGDAVVAFAGGSLSTQPHAVCWAGVIGERLPFAQYWRDPRFHAKKSDRSSTPDNIDEPDSLGLRQMPNSSHDQRSVGTDLGGQFVLVFAEAWHFGARGPVLPAEFGLRMVGGRRRHRVHPLSDQRWSELRAWLESQKSGVATPSDGRCAPARARGTVPATQRRDNQKDPAELTGEELVREVTHGGRGG